MESRTDIQPFSSTIATLSWMVVTMHRLAAAMLVLLCCCCCRCLFLATHAHPQQLQPAAGGDRASPSCIPHERDALLAFKHGVTSDPAGLLDSWRRDGGHGNQDCCRWRGVRCSNLTGHVHKLQLRGNYGEGADFLVGQISHSLLALEHLEHLDVSQNDLVGPNSRIPEFLGSLKNLKYLNLSGIPFYGSVPPHLGNLSRLQYLDLSAGWFLGRTNSTDLSWLTRLSSIQYLNLNKVNLSTVADWPHVMNMLPSLRVLHLSWCHLVSANQSLPHLNLTDLEELDASGNSFDHPMETSWFWNITSLKYLYLQYTSMYGQFPDALGDMTSLKVLDLSYFNNIDDKYRIMTTNLKNLCNLEVLNLCMSLSYGDVTELLRNLPRCSPNKLQELQLSFNQLSGMLPRWIGQLTSLVLLNLGWNNITRSLPISVGQLTGLQTLDLSGNNLNGHVPYEIGELSNLTYLDLSRNKLDGMIAEEHFASARNLKYIDLSHNDLKIDLSSDWQPPSGLDIVRFASCQMGPLFPGWLQWNVSVTYLDISSAGIFGKLPQWFSDAFSNFKFLSTSNNQLNGTLPTDMGSMSLRELYLSSNQFTGQIPIVLPPNISNLDLSNNLLSGPLPSVVGSANLEQLSLFSNKITGHIPKSFCKFQGLYELDLSNNFLVGELPSCLRVMENIEFIALSNNSLLGEFPSFVQNFTNLLFLDLSRNKFSGGLPIWIGKLRSLVILRLSHNKFYGNIPVNITNLACLQYMDLNNNMISGSLPSHFLNLETMKRTQVWQCGMEYINNPDPVMNDHLLGPSFHLSTMSMVLKGQELDYGSLDRVLDSSMVSIDLSCNNLVGKIPEEIVFLDRLVNLNFSWNHLSGVVPNKIGEMQSLESLDLSRNMLSGEIPSTLSNLTFLSYMDLSYNNLTGRIPPGSQLDTLYAAYPSMYIGNNGLCGHPLPNNCSKVDDAPKEGGVGRTEGHGIEFFYLGLGCGFMVGTWMAFGVLLLKRSWRIACFQISDKLCDKVYVLVAIWARKTETDHQCMKQRKWLVHACKNRM